MVIAEMLRARGMVFIDREKRNITRFHSIDDIAVQEKLTQRSLDGDLPYRHSAHNEVFTLMQYFPLPYWKVSGSSLTAHSNTCVSIR